VFAWDGLRDLQRRKKINCGRVGGIPNATIQRREIVVRKNQNRTFFEREPCAWGKGLLRSTVVCLHKEGARKLTGEGEKMNKPFILMGDNRHRLEKNPSRY